MPFIIAIVTLAGHIALLLWGTRMVQTGIQRAFGPSLRSFLGRALNNRMKAFLSGMGVTAILQSSTATGLMASGFAAEGLVALVPALAVMLGANVGSTLIVQVLSFDVAAASPALILLGVLMFRRTQNPQVHDLGRVFIGLGFMLLALHQLLEVLTQYAGTPAFSAVLSAISTTPLLSLLLAAALTWAAHSSVAVVLLVMSLSAQGLIDPYQAFALTLGANLGTAINPVVEGQSGNDLSAKRLPIGNLITRIIGVLAALALLSPITSLMMQIESDGARLVANFHTAFNLVVAVVFMPLLTPFANALVRLMPQRIDESDPGQPRYLDPSAKETPVVALQAAAREVLRLVDVLEEMLAGTKSALTSTDRRALSELRQKDNVLDRLNTAVKRYLTSIDPEEFSDSDRRRLDEILLFSTGLEHAGDVLDQNVLPHLAKRLRRGMTFSKEGQLELNGLLDRLSTNLRTAAALFMSQDERVARMLADEKIVFRRAERDGTNAHFKRLRNGDVDTAESTSLHLDLLRDFKQINSHLVAATAYPVLERQGELLQSRTIHQSAADPVQN
ncbi:Na/Pi cotransporter family protein [Neorhizobium galegae]|uniref:Na/Pi cotransporter family protein n=2 Tax=Neorhizobium galegae TaxID=399 RepID=A0A6A1TQN4_NEOGA|nr:Na/Pi cotransporter family protein [Neorhizobium galegae]KAB1086912.1 Na/Pi cotransporter family protein [Neorhizobium galegae]MCQ1853809.1 Na/Pi cotransporter family protein [Neorhizobium galegae]CDN48161.1 Putative Na+/phosphate transporter [Neorhizobium galegae bv. orientalis str. HAMBI 540]CDZ46485.1 Sodium-dependent inorganic phosphate (Pi) transporter [Neorhizobium galegae bv. orientalis]